MEIDDTKIIFDLPDRKFDDYGKLQIQRRIMAGMNVRVIIMRQEEESE